MKEVADPSKKLLRYRTLIAVVLIAWLIAVVIAVVFKPTGYEFTVIKFRTDQSVETEVRKVAREIADRHSMYLLEEPTEPNAEVQPFLRATSSWWRMRFAYNPGPPEFVLSRAFGELKLAIYVSCGYEGEIDLFTEWEQELNRRGIRFGYGPNAEKDRIMSRECP